MRFQGLDLNLLVALDALLNERNVSLAAERMGLSQPAMSGALARLRKYFDDELLVTAGGRQPLLTPLARELAMPVHTALQQIRNSVIDRAEFVAANSNRHFRVVASDYAVRLVLAGAIRRMSSLAPGITFEIFNPGVQASSSIDRSEADLMILPEQFLSAQHPRRFLFEDNYVVVAWSGNKLLGESISAEEYFGLGHVSVSFDRGRVAAFDDWFLQHARKPRRVEVVAPAFTDAPQFVIGTQRIATMHRQLALYFARTMELKLYPVPFDIPSIRQSVQWHTLQSKDAAILWVVDQMCQSLEE
ncbi:MAG TPA: LysR family transcriptional regulator [Steroidobacteraceae bacterium]|nr:LysR family transcriptional regulator [Steroidobacteraceae bacterium]